MKAIVYLGRKVRVPDNAKWVAVDKSGAGFWYSHRPSRKSSVFSCSHYFDYFGRIGSFTVEMERFNLDWHDTLERVENLEDL